MCVNDTGRQGRNVAFPMIISSTSSNGAIALEQNSVRRSRGNLIIDYAVWQDGDVALSTPIPPASNDSAITLQQKSAPASNGNLGVDDTI